MYTPSLPYRRLVKFANGIWDENRKTFYSYKVATSTLPAKRGVMYFIKNLSVTGTNFGDAAAGYVGVYITKDGTQFTVCPCYINQTTAASNVGACNSGFAQLDLLCDVNTAISVLQLATSFTRIIQYAEIPVEGTGVPVVVQ